MEIGIDALVDEAASCCGGASHPYAIGVAELAHLLADLTKKAPPRRRLGHEPNPGRSVATGRQRRT